MRVCCLPLRVVIGIQKPGLHATGIVRYVRMKPGWAPDSSETNRRKAALELTMILRGAEVQVHLCEAAGLDAANAREVLGRLLVRGEDDARGVARGRALEVSYSGSTWYASTMNSRRAGAGTTTDQEHA